MRYLSENIRDAASKLGIQFPTPLPLFRGAPDVGYLTEWAESQHTPMTRKIAHKVIQHLQYIAFEDFLKQLQQTMDDFHQRAGDAPYVLLVGELESDKLAQGCSDLWVIGLALEYCKLKEPEMILTPQRFLAYHSAHPAVTHVLMLDDASYSGAQKSQILQYLSEKKTRKACELSFYIGIPFMTQQAKKVLSNYSAIFKEVFFLHHADMPSTINCLDAEEIFYMSATGVGYIGSGYTLTYFDHRFADFFSCFQYIYDGSQLLGDQIAYIMKFQGYVPDSNVKIAKTNNNLQLLDAKQYYSLACLLVATNHSHDCHGHTIPTIIPPYKLHNADAEALIDLKRAIAQGKIGIRSPYHAPNSHTQAIISQPTLPKPSFFHFQQSGWELKKQIGYDNAVMHGNHQDITYDELVAMHNKHQQVQQELKTAFPILKPRKTQPAHSFLQRIFHAPLQPFNLFMILIGLRLLFLIIQRVNYPDVSTENSCKISNQI